MTPKARDRASCEEKRCLVGELIEAYEKKLEISYSMDLSRQRNTGLRFWR